MKLTIKSKKVICLMLIFCVILLFPTEHVSAAEQGNHKTIMVFSPHQDDEANMANAVMYSHAKRGDDVYVVMGFGSDSSPSRKDTTGLRRMNESKGNLERLGIPAKNLIYLGYQSFVAAAKVFPEEPEGYRIIQFGSNGEMLLKDGTPYYTFSHKEEGFPSFHSTQYGEECLVSEANLVSDIQEVIKKYMPDEIYVVDLDKHVEHMWYGSMVDKAFGLLKQDPDYQNYCPRYYESLSYQSSWYAKSDFDSTTSPNGGGLFLESTLKFDPRNPTLDWEDRVRFAVDDEMSMPDVEQNLSILAYRYGFGKTTEGRLKNLVNGDQVFWERDTQNLTYQASVEVSSNAKDKDKINDFTTIRTPMSVFTNYVYHEADLTCDDYKWSPTDADETKTVTVTFDEPKDIASVKLYDDYLEENQITAGVLTFSNGDRIEVGALDNDGGATAISFDEKKGITSVSFKITDFIGTPGLTEFEVFAQGAPRKTEFIQIYLDKVNGTDWANKSFLYDYPVSVLSKAQSMQLGVYSYPNETESSGYIWSLAEDAQGISLSADGLLTVDQSAKTGVYQIRATAKDDPTLFDDMTIKVTGKWENTWDINRDGKCDYRDFACVLMGLDGFNYPRADVNEDGIVDSKDVDIVLAHIAETSAFSGGSGSPENPYQIETQEQLHAATGDYSYILTKDITINEAPRTNRVLAGCLDGNGHTVTGLTQPLYSNFADGSDATVRNINLVYEGTDAAAVVAAKTYQTSHLNTEGSVTLSNVHVVVKGTLTGAGLIGDNGSRQTVVENCGVIVEGKIRNNGGATGKVVQVGGLIQTMRGGSSIKSSFVYIKEGATIEAETSADKPTCVAAGGIAGTIIRDMKNETNIENCYVINEGNISASVKSTAGYSYAGAGGIFGTNYTDSQKIKISSSYVYNAGNLAFENAGTDKIQNIGFVTGMQNTKTETSLTDFIGYANSEVGLIGQKKSGSSPSGTYQILTDAAKMKQADTYAGFHLNENGTKWLWEDNESPVKDSITSLKGLPYLLMEFYRGPYGNTKQELVLETETENEGSKTISYTINNIRAVAGELIVTLPSGVKLMNGNTQAIDGDVLSAVTGEDADIASAKLAGNKLTIIWSADAGASPRCIDALHTQKAVLHFQVQPQTAGKHVITAEGKVIDNQPILDAAPYADNALSVEITKTADSGNTSTGGGGSYTPIQKPIIEKNANVKTELSSDGTKLTIKAEDGYEITDVLVNGVSKGAAGELTGLKTGDKVEIKTAKKAEPIQPTDPSTDKNAKLVKGINATSIILKSKLTENRKVLLTWTKSKGYKVDSFEIYRSVKKNSGYGKTAFFKTKDGNWSKYLNTKGLKAGKTYYYKVRGVRMIDGKKYYTQWSNKSWRTI